jgi:hypothetical protein
VQSDADFKKWMDEQVAEARKLSGN